MRLSPARSFAQHSSRVEYLLTTNWLKFVSLKGEKPAVEALGYVERAKSRALADALAGRISFSTDARDDFEAHLQAQVAKLREELNYLYNQMHRSVRGPVQIQEDNSALERRTS